MKPRSIIFLRSEHKPGSTLSYIDSLYSIFFQAVKKNMIENIIPIVIAMKHKLEKAKSPLLNDLMTCLRELMKDYKNEVKDMLAADKQLATEIEYDLKKWEEEQKKLEESRKESQVSVLNYIHCTVSAKVHSKEMIF
jgi:hypothetical protein